MFIEWCCEFGSTLTELIINAHILDPGLQIHAWCLKWHVGKVGHWITAYGQQKTACNSIFVSTWLLKERICVYSQCVRKRRITWVKLFMQYGKISTIYCSMTFKRIHSSVNGILYLCSKGKKNICIYDYIFIKYLCKTISDTGEGMLFLGWEMNNQGTGFGGRDFSVHIQYFAPHKDINYSIFFFKLESENDFTLRVTPRGYYSVIIR